MLSLKITEQKIKCKKYQIYNEAAAREKYCLYWKKTSYFIFIKK